MHLGQLVDQQRGLEQNRPDDQRDIGRGVDGRHQRVPAGADAGHKTGGQHHPVGRSKLALHPSIQPPRPIGEGAKPPLRRTGGLNVHGSLFAVEAEFRPLKADPGPRRNPVA